MKILLIRPIVTYYKNQAIYSPYEPLGLMYLAAFLRMHGYSDVRILDASAKNSVSRWDVDFYKIGMSDAEFKAEVSSFAPDVVGISAMYTVNSKGVHDTAALIKLLYPGVPIIVGGAHASAFPEWILKDENIDYVAKGEGEATLLDFLQAYSSGADLCNIKGLVFRKGGKVFYSPPREFIHNLDSVPFPARDLVEMGGYLNEFYNKRHSMSPPRATVVTSRGCPYNCIFCSIQSLWCHSYRVRTPKNVVDEIEFLVRQYGVREIAFFDDNLSFHRKRMAEICDELILRRLNVRWCTPNGIAIWTLDEPLLEKMKASGCYKLTFGIETGSLNTQKFIRKEQVDLLRSKEIIAACAKIGIWTHSPFIIGFPYETKADIEATIQYALSSGLDMATFFIATPYPGTDLYEIYKKDGLLPDLGSENALEWLGAVGRAMVGTHNFTTTDIERLVSYAQKKIYIRLLFRLLSPVRLIKKLSGFDEIRYFVRQMFMYALKMLRV